MVWQVWSVHSVKNVSSENANLAKQEAAAPKSPLSKEKEINDDIVGTLASLWTQQKGVSLQLIDYFVQQSTCCPRYLVHAQFLDYEMS